MKYTLTYLDKKEIAENTFEFIFSKPTDFNYCAGQFISAYVNGEMREFTLVSSPRQNVISFSTRIRSSLFKDCLMKLQAGDSITIEGPFGRFVLSKNNSRAVFLVGGIGVTPLVSMIRSGLEKAIILYSFRNDPAYINLIKDSDNELHCFQTSGMLSQCLDGFSERISLTILDKILPLENKNSLQFYVSGTADFVSAMISFLFVLNISAKAIVTDSFGSY